MEKLKLYKVTKASSDGTFNIGDIIWLSNNEDLNSCKGCGWLPKSEWEECTDYYLDVTDRSEEVRRKFK